MPFNHNILIKAGAIPAFINMLNTYSRDPDAVLSPLTMLAGLTKDPSNVGSMYDNKDSELAEAVFKVIAKNSNNKEILIKCVSIISNIDTKISMSDATNAILFCEAVSFVTTNGYNVVTVNDTEADANAESDDEAEVDADAESEAYSH
jgi:hypothetical protein